jgi:phasin family protein
MFNATQYAASQKAALASFAKVANVYLESTKKLLDLQVSVATELVVDSVKNVESLGNVKDVKSAAALQEAAKPAFAKSLAYAKSVFGVFVSASAEIRVIAEAQVEEVSKQVTGAFENATKNAPAGSEPAVAFVKSALSAASGAADQAAKNVKELIDTAEANVAAAFAALEKPLAQA